MTPKSIHPSTAKEASQLSFTTPMAGACHIFALELPPPARAPKILVEYLTCSSMRRWSLASNTVLGVVVLLDTFAFLLDHMHKVKISFFVVGCSLVCSSLLQNLLGEFQPHLEADEHNYFPPITQTLEGNKTADG